MMPTYQPVPAYQPGVLAPTATDNGLSQHHQNEVQYMDKLARHKALTLLVSGAVFGISGFAFAAIAGFWDKSPSSSVLRIPFASGHPHFPMTVSEMVHDPASPTGKAFQGFELVAAILLLTSWYPYQLCNVYVGERHTLFEKKTGKCCGCMSWPTLRQFLPALGLGIVAMITTTPTYDKKAANTSFITCQIHILAASALFAGYIIVELQCLCVAYGKGVVKIGKMERCVRLIVITITAIGAVTTIVMQFTVPYIPDDMVCCADKWVLMDHAQLEKAKNMTSGIPDPLDAAAKMQAALMLYNNEMHFEMDTASGTYRILKMICFWAEVVAGVFGLGSMIVIWWYAPERQLVVGDYIEFKDLGTREPDGYYEDETEDEYE